MSRYLGLSARWLLWNLLTCNTMIMEIVSAKIFSHGNWIWLLWNFIKIHQIILIYIMILFCRCNRLSKSKMFLCYNLSVMKKNYANAPLGPSYSQKLLIISDLNGLWIINVRRSISSHIIYFRKVSVARLGPFKQPFYCNLLDMICKDQRSSCWLESRSQVARTFYRRLDFKERKESTLCC